MPSFNQCKLVAGRQLHLQLGPLAVEEHHKVQRSQRLAEADLVRQVVVQVRPRCRRGLAREAAPEQFERPARRRLEGSRRGRRREAQPRSDLLQQVGPRPGLGEYSALQPDGVFTGYRLGQRGYVDGQGGIGLAK